jgi:hypothetical protein
MQLKDRDGIACDQCGTTYKTDFLYYSFDFRLVPVHENRRAALQQLLNQEATFSLDICTACFEKIKTKVVENYSKGMRGDVKHRGRPQVGVVCELSGEKLIGTFNYYHCNVVKVNVRMSGQPNVCVKCQKQTYVENQPCEGCGGTDFVRPADTKIDDRFVEINISEPEFRGMVDRAESMRKVAGEWATKS